MKKVSALVLSIVLMAALLAGCGQPADKASTPPVQTPAQTPPANADPVTLVATDNGWDSQKIHTQIAKTVVEHAFDGYILDTSTAASSMNWLAIINGDVDLDIESWTDNVATYEDDKAAGDIVDVGVLVPDSRQGLYVPRYVVEGDTARGIEAVAPDLKTVNDLKNYPQLFPDDENPEMGRLYGGIAGWMADEVLTNKYEAYGLNETFTYVRLGSEGALFASLEAAYNLGEPWVGYCYEPTVIAGKLDLILLEDEPYDSATFTQGLCEFPEQELKIVSSKFFAEKAPELLPFFNNYVTGSEVINAALAHFDESGDYEETVIWLLKNHDELLDQWLPSENAEKLRSYLSTLD